MPEALRRLNFIFFDDPAKFEASLERLTEALQTDIGWIRKHTELGEAARRWATAGRIGGLLLRSSVLEEAERWIASGRRMRRCPARSAGVHRSEPTRPTRRRNIRTGSLAAGLAVALGAGRSGLLAAGHCRRADEQRLIAEQQRKRAEDTLAAATNTAYALVFDLAQRLQERRPEVPAELVKDILDKARALQEQLIKSGQVTPELKASQAEALVQTVDSAARDRRHGRRAF